MFKSLLKHDVQYRILGVPFKIPSYIKCDFLHSHIPSVLEIQKTGCIAYSTISIVRDEFLETIFIYI